MVALGFPLLEIFCFHLSFLVHGWLIPALVNFVGVKGVFLLTTPSLLFQHYVLLIVSPAKGDLSLGVALACLGESGSDHIDNTSWHVLLCVFITVSVLFLHVCKFEISKIFSVFQRFTQIGFGENHLIPKWRQQVRGSIIWKEQFVKESWQLTLLLVHLYCSQNATLSGKFSCPDVHLSQLLKYFWKDHQSR